MKRHAEVLAVFALALVSSGCLRKDTTHTLYLSPDGGLRWVVDESGVRSDDEDESKRLEAEQSYIGSALVGDHPMAQALRAIGPDGVVRTTIVRDERPFHVITDAHSSRADQALQRLFRTCGLNASVTVSEDGEVTRLTMRFDFTRRLDLRETPACELIDEFQDFRFVLTRGRFVEGGGFDVRDRVGARMSAEAFARLEAAAESRATVDLVLAWSSER